MKTVDEIRQLADRRARQYRSDGWPQIADAIRNFTDEIEPSLQSLAAQSTALEGARELLETAATGESIQFGAEYWLRYNPKASVPMLAKAPCSRCEHDAFHHASNRGRCYVNGCACQRFAAHPKDPQRLAPGEFGGGK